MRVRRAFCYAAALAGLMIGLPACEQTKAEAGPAASARGPVSAEQRARDEKECEKVAYKRFQEIPVISSGKSSYLSGDEIPFFFRECMAERGHG